MRILEIFEALDDINSASAVSSAHADIDAERKGRETKSKERKASLGRTSRKIKAGIKQLDPTQNKKLQLSKSGKNRSPVSR